MESNATGSVKIQRLDHGEPPAAVLEQQKKLEEFLKPEAAHPGPVAESSRAGSDAGELIGDSLGVSMRIRPAGSERVTLEYVPEDPKMPAFGLEFLVGEVCYRPNYVSLLIMSDLGFKPTALMKFNLKHGSKTTPVIFAGAEFEFQTVGVRGISFIVDKKRTP